MKRANPLNPNTKLYWNSLYATPDKREFYAKEGTDEEHGHTKPTARFTKALEEIKAGDTVLDIGAGVGVFTELVKDTYPDCEVWGVDISDTAMKANEERRPDIKYFQYYIGNNQYLPLATFDVVFSGETLEHLDDPNDLFKDAFRALKPDGKLIITTPLNDAIRSEEHTWYFNNDDVDGLFRVNGFSRPKFVYLPDMEHLLVIMAVGIKNND